MYPQKRLQYYVLPSTTCDLFSCVVIDHDVHHDHCLQKVVIVNVPLLALQWMFSDVEFDEPILQEMKL